MVESELMEWQRDMKVLRGMERVRMIGSRMNEDECKRTMYRMVPVGRTGVHIL
jgi:hypothetical protein